MSVWLLTDDAMDAHVSAGHPERPERRLAAVEGVRDGTTAAGVDLQAPAVVVVPPALLSAVHVAGYAEMIQAAAGDGGGWLDPDTYVAPGSALAASLAAGATVQAALAVAAGDAEVAFAAVRPPGHHAHPAGGRGFCIFNNAALAVAALRGEPGIHRVAILDWDVHHGDGTQAIFDADPDVTYASTHESPLYPGTGAASDRGHDAGAGTMHNRPLRAGDGDPEFIAAWRDELLPAIEAARPQALLVSAGYDAHRDDPLADLRVTEDGYAAVAELVGAMSARLGLAGVALTLEGGYDLAALRASVAATVTGIVRGRRQGPKPSAARSILDPG